MGGFWFCRYRPSQTRRPGQKRREIQPFAVPLPDPEKQEVDLDWHLQEVVDKTEKVSIDAQTDE